MTVFRQNSPYLDADPRVDLATRIATFEHLPEKHDCLPGRNLHHEEKLTSEHVTRSVEHACFSIVDHIKKVTGGALELHQMTLYFKLDHKFRLWLLFCSSIKIKDLLLKDEKDFFPKKAKNSIITNLHRSVEIFGIENTEKDNMALIQKEAHIDRSPDAIYTLNPRQKVCALCFSTLLLTIGFSFSFACPKLEHLVSFFQNDPKHPGLLSALNVIFIKEHNRSEARLPKLIKDPLWLNLTFQCCDSCYTILTEEFLSLNPMRMTMPIRRVLEARIGEKQRIEDSMFDDTTNRDRLDTFRSNEATVRTRLNSVEDGYSVISKPTSNFPQISGVYDPNLKRSLTPNTAELPFNYPAKFAKFHTQVYKSQRTRNASPQEVSKNPSTSGAPRLKILPRPIQTPQPAPPQTPNPVLNPSPSSSPLKAPLTQLLQARKRLTDSTQQLAHIPGEYFLRSRATSNGLIKESARTQVSEVQSNTFDERKMKKPGETTETAEYFFTGKKQSVPSSGMEGSSQRKNLAKSAYRLISATTQKNSPRNFKWSHEIYLAEVKKAPSSGKKVL